MPKVIQLESTGTNCVLKSATIPHQPIEGNLIRVQTIAAALNRFDLSIYCEAQKESNNWKLNNIPGIEAIGDVVKVGDSASKLTNHK